MADLIYLDNAATTRLAAGAAAAMAEAAQQLFGNPASAHGLGQAAANRLEQERRSLAELLGCRAEEIRFVSGGTEADNLAVAGAARASRKRKLVISAIEHPAVLSCGRALEEQGLTVARVPVDGDGCVAPEALLELVDGETFLVSIIHGNNEIGTLQPVAELATLVKGKSPDCLFHTDAVQSFGRCAIDLAGAQIDLLSLSAHKFHGPRGVGALYVRKGTKLSPLLHGGDQEGGLRPGTVNLPGIAGMGAAAREQLGDLAGRRGRLAALARALTEPLLAEVRGLVLNGHPTERLPGLVSVSVPGVRAQHLMHFLEEAGVIVSAGAACKSTSERTSHVLEAIGRRQGYGTIRLSLSDDNTMEEAAAAASHLIRVIRRLVR